MSKRRGRTPVVTRDHMISTLTYIRTLVDALITTLDPDFDYPQLPAPMRPALPYRKDCPPPEVRGKIYGKDCPPPEEVVQTIYSKIYGKDCPPPEVETVTSKIYGKDCPPPEEVETVTVKVRPVRGTSMTLVLPKKQARKQKR